MYMMHMLYRLYGGTLAVLICGDYFETSAAGWRLLADGSRDTLVEFARAAGIHPIFAPRSGRYADIRASIVGFEQQRRRELERRADKLRRCLDYEHLDEHGPTADEIGQIRDELESIGEQLAELATEDERGEEKS